MSFDEIFDLTASWSMYVFLKYHVVALLPTKLLSQVIKYSSAGIAVEFIGQITLFEGRRPSEKRAKKCFLDGTLQLFFGS